MIKFIAHRGFGKLKKQNTGAAFEYAANSKAYGIETDVRITKDEVFVAFHDANTARLCGRDYFIEKSDFKNISKLKVFDRHRRAKIPTLVEFLNYCKLGAKFAIMEIKSRLNKEQVISLIELIDKEMYLDKTVFISFNVDVLKIIRDILPNQQIQLISRKYNNEILNCIIENKFDLDVYYKTLTEEIIEECNKFNIKVNCWTVNKTKIIKKLAKWGVDFITSDKFYEGF